ncbi:acetoacetate--CoA ligase [Roseisolibacter sp. H3M3-2]|uniref:acetoacetate--CoA ligase n=1 Tax=Roseisolibacter sp. H3M3-2 TaxID=3031323 RepID=UPI0023DCB522|nr:acetoacetate--CoA ligase [Roseisolibacter sp. H3M3-2]MDF1502044.1 acetoacetate--CoA ligase [Roseisolibacter sp. H3M3-2]
MTHETADARPIWEPTADDVARANLTAFLAEARPVAGDDLRDYGALWRWSVDAPEAFWRLVWRFGGVVGDPGGTTLVGGDRVAPPDPQLGPRWFPEARLNFAENLLRHAGPGDALVAWTEGGVARRLSFDALREEVARVAAGLRDAGVGVGDRVAGFVPNGAEAVVAMLAAASLGALWSSCSPDFGVQGVLDRFGQIEPTVLVCADGYTYARKPVDVLPRVRAIVDAIPSIRTTVVVAGVRDAEALAAELATLRGGVAWDAFGTRGAPLAFARLPFDHPLYIMYSSGTTGLPKCMVHGAGGTLLQHLKELALHTDLRAGDRLFYFTTCGWMMWNWMVSGLALGTTVVLYDGSPTAPRPEILWDVVAAEGVTAFGTSAKYLALAEKSGVAPARTHDLAALRCILSTGSPLAAYSYDYVARDVKPGVRLSSISGGTDIISCFALGNPIGPVWRGELQVRGLGMAVDVFDDAGRPLRGEAGELVCTRPFPSMPVAFWNDPDGAKYRAAYFDVFPNTWRHGDWAELTPRDGLVIHGRSDATLNPGGVRIGTAEIYRQVEQIPEVVESVVIEQMVGAGADSTSRIVLFVRLAEGATLDRALQARIRDRIREHCSAHHVPRIIAAVPDIPRTISGKISELAVRAVVHGAPVKNVDALANPDALASFRAHPALGA